VSRKNIQRVLSVFLTDKFKHHGWIISEPEETLWFPLTPGEGLLQRDYCAITTVTAEEHLPATGRRHPRLALMA
jgi:hypothetical protein